MLQFLTLLRSKFISKHIENSNKHNVLNDNWIYYEARVKKHSLVNVGVLPLVNLFVIYEVSQAIMFYNSYSNCLIFLHFVEKKSNSIFFIIVL